jgi:hypothetical protein
MKSRLLALFLAGMLLLHVLLAWNSRELVRKGYPDFTIFYSAGKIVRQGLGRHMYEEQVQYRIQQEFASGVSIRQGALPYNHPPFEALIFVPLTWLPYVVAYLLWDLLNLLILFALPFLLRPHMLVLQQTPGAAWLFVSLAFFPIFIALLQGQDIILLLLLFTLAFVALKKGADFVAGCWLALGLFRFHLILPLIFILLLQRRRKAVLGFVLIAAALTAVSVAVVGWKTTLGYPSYVWHLEQTTGHGAIVSADMPNLRGLFDTVLAGRVPQVTIHLVVVFLSIALVLLASAKWNPSSSGGVLDLVFSLTVVVLVLVSYHALIYDLSMLLLPILFLANRFPALSSAPGWTRAALFIPILVLFFSPLQMDLWFHSGPKILLPPLLTFWIWGMWREISREARLSQPQSVPL